jgi:iron complex outermembrane receptor protein
MVESPTLQAVIGNAGGLKSEGAEATFALQATHSLTFNGSVTYADAYFTNYVYNTTTNYTGSNLTNAPRWSAFLNVDYSHELGALSGIPSFRETPIKTMTYEKAVVDINH